MPLIPPPEAPPPKEPLGPPPPIPEGLTLDVSAPPEQPDDGAKRKLADDQITCVLLFLYQNNISNIFYQSGIKGRQSYVRHPRIGRGEGPCRHRC